VPQPFHTFVSISSIPTHTTDIISPTFSTSIVGTVPPVVDPPTPTLRSTPTNIVDIVIQYDNTNTENSNDEFNVVEFNDDTLCNLKFNPLEIDQ
ncbi:hypothetical protein KI387_012627, partial [Taxus chinensis]